MIFRKIVCIIKGDVGVEELNRIYKIVDAKEDAEEESGLWWGF